MKLTTILIASLLSLAPLFQERALGVRRTVYVLEVDLARARALGWAEEDVKDETVLAAAVRVVKKRLDAMEREFALETDAEHHRIELAMPQVQPRDRELFAQLLQGIGLCEFLFVLDDSLWIDAGADMMEETVKLIGWRAENPSAPLTVFNALEDREKAPHPRIWWVDPEVEAEIPWPVLLPDCPEDCFGAGSFAKANRALDAKGGPAVEFHFVEGRKDDFARVTEVRTDEKLGILVEGKLRSAPTLNGKLENGGIIEGAFSEEEVEHLLDAFAKRAGPLRVVEVR